MTDFKTNLFRSAMRLWPYQKGKQRIAQAYYLKFLSRSNQTRLANVGNLKLSLKLSDRIQAIFYLTGLYEPATVSACVSKLKPGSVYIDVGANTGLLAIQILARSPRTICHLFEADPGVFSQLEHNLKSNELTGYKINNLAVTDKSGVALTFFPSSNDGESGWGRLQNQKLETRTGLKVNSVGLDDYLGKEMIKRVDLLKIDVEGAEETVLRGAQKSLQAKLIKTVICEINEGALAEFNSSPAAVKKILTDAGYAEIARFEMNCMFEPL
jgi:FkbM family methyltransferase